MPPGASTSPTKNMAGNLVTTDSIALTDPLSWDTSDRQGVLIFAADSSGSRPSYDLRLTLSPALDVYPRELRESQHEQRQCYRDHPEEWTCLPPTQERCTVHMEYGQ